MTVETKTTIQLSDVKAVEFECKHCRRILSWPIATMKHPPIDCDCGTPQWMPFGGDTFAALTQLIQLICRFRAANNEPFEMRLVIGNLNSRDESE